MSFVDNRDASDIDVSHRGFFIQALEIVIELKRRYTSNQVARGAMPDAEKFNRMYLIKNVPTLRATYQIRLLAFMAVESKKQLILRVPATCVFHESLETLMKLSKKSVIRENY
jgi:hypothetical protein